MKLNFVTGNKNKFMTGQDALAGSGFDLVQRDLEVPEIQSEDVGEVASFSARWAAGELGEPAVVTDAGYYFTALNGFPGPFVKYINQWLTVEGMLALMGDNDDRSVLVKGALGYCEPNRESVIFTVKIRGSMLKQPDPQARGSIMNQVFIPEGFDTAIGAWSEEQQRAFWVEREFFWADLAAYLKIK